MVSNPLGPICMQVYWEDRKQTLGAANIERGKGEMGQIVLPPQFPCHPGGVYRSGHDRQETLS